MACGLVLLAACSESDPEPSEPYLPSATATPPPASSVAPFPPTWEVGAQSLPLRPDGFGVVSPTPPELVDRRLPTRDLLAPPTSGGYESSISPVPADVLARSTWHAGCPVAASELRYLRMSFRGFDGRAHTGEMIVRQDVAQDVVGVFGRLFEVGFPIEEMRITATPELTLPPTGDGNNTNAFVCRPARGLSRFSAHAYGLAIDLDPFQNPYTKGDLVLPELASSYLDRDNRRPGMIVDGDEALAAFEAIGWTWGGHWSNPRDIMHFSETGD